MRKIKVSKSRVAAAALLLLVLVVGILFPVSGSSAKYTTQVSLSGKINYQFGTPLAASLKVDGTGTYKLIPGTTVTPGATVAVTGKTETPAYLYVEVVGTLPKGLELDSLWTEVKEGETAVPGPNGGSLYLYGTSALAEGNNITGAPVFKSFTTDKEPATAPAELRIRAFLIEKVGDADALTSYKNRLNEGVSVSEYGPRSEIFEIAQVSAVVNGDYTVQNTGNIDALIRATVVLNYVDEAGNIVASDSPLLKEGVTALSTPAGWTKVGDYLYYNGTVAPNGTTTKPVFSEANAAEAAEGVTVTVTVEAIQAAGDAAAEKWTEATYDPATSNWTTP